MSKTIYVVLEHYDSEYDKTAIICAYEKEDQAQTSVEKMNESARYGLEYSYVLTELWQY